MLPSSQGAAQSNRGDYVYSLGNDCYRSSTMAWNRQMFTQWRNSNELHTNTMSFCHCTAQRVAKEHLCERHTHLERLRCDPCEADLYVNTEKPK